MYLYKGEDMQIEGGWKNSEKSVRKKNYLSEREREREKECVTPWERKFSYCNTLALKYMVLMKSIV